MRRVQLESLAILTGVDVLLFAVRAQSRVHGNRGLEMWRKVQPRVQPKPRGAAYVTAKVACGFHKTVLDARQVCMRRGLLLHTLHTFCHIRLAQIYSRHVAIITM